MKQKLFKNQKIDLRRYSMFIALISIMILFQILTGSILLKPINISKMIMQNSYVLILAIGMLPCILTGNVDLSVGSVLGFISAICGTLIITRGYPVWLTIIIALLIGALVGAWQGFWIAYIRVPAFIVTLAGMLIFKGLTMVILKGNTLAPFPESYLVIPAKNLPQLKLGGGKIDLISMGIVLIFVILLFIFQLRQKMKKLKYQKTGASLGLSIAGFAVISFVILFAGFWVSQYRGLPNVLLLLVALIVLYTFITQNTVIGRNIYALGGNEKASKLSGIKTNRVLFLAYMNMGVMAALAGIIFSGRLNAAAPSAGTGFELDAIAACYIGGASASGGIGTITGAVIGGLVMGVLNNGMSIMGIGIDWQQAIKGLVLLVAVAFDVSSRRRSA